MRLNALLGIAPKSGAAVLLAAFAAAVLPPKEILPAAWAEEHRIVPPESGSPFPGPWSNSLTPYLIEPMNCCAAGHPAKKVVLMSSAQAAKTSLLENVFGYRVHLHPGPVLVLLPTIDEAQKFQRIKLGPMIQATDVLAKRVLEEKSRDGESSTALFKRFPGGYAVIAGANSSKALQMVSYALVLADEVDEMKADVGGRGDPLTQAEARTKAWQDKGAKLVAASTPGIKGESRIEAEYEGSDQRKPYVPCPHCGAYQVLLFENLRWSSDREPYNAYFACALHGCVIDESAKGWMTDPVRLRWIKTYEGDPDNPKPPAVFEAVELDLWSSRPDFAYPGFWFWQAYSQLASWDQTVREYFASEGNPEKRRTFTQQTLGLPADIAGEAPDIERLMERREPFKGAAIPPGVVYLAASIDVQGSWFEWAVYGFSRDFSVWHIDRGVIEAETTKADSWALLDPLLLKTYRDAWGQEWPVDHWGIDSGYQTTNVYLWGRRHQFSGRVKVLDGLGQWNRPALGNHAMRRFRSDGRRMKVKVYPVGTWDLKVELYTRLGYTAQGQNANGQWLSGAWHFGQNCDEKFFEQFTADYLCEKELKSGGVKREWRKRGPNEQHDLAIYALALAHGELDGKTARQWDDLVARRTKNAAPVQGDLESLWSKLSEASPADSPKVATPAGVPPSEPLYEPAPRPAVQPAAKPKVNRFAGGKSSSMGNLW